MRSGRTGRSRRRGERADRSRRPGRRRPGSRPTPGFPPGSVLTRKYKGGVVQVKVLADGFEYQGAVYSSLSAVAKTVAGSHCNGFLFFQLIKKGDAA